MMGLKPGYSQEEKRRIRDKSMGPLKRGGWRQERDSVITKSREKLCFSLLIPHFLNMR